MLAAMAAVLEAHSDWKVVARPGLEFQPRLVDFGERREHMTQPVAAPDAQARHVDKRAMVVEAYGD